MAAKIVRSYGEFLKNRPFFDHFWLCFSDPSHTILMHRAHRSTFGCRMTVLNFIKIIRKIFDKTEIFIERSGERKKVPVKK